MVRKLILKEITADEISETMARNLTAWDTSKDKKTGLLPEVYETNKYLYKVLTGGKYSFCNACDKFHISDD